MFGLIAVAFVVLTGQSQRSAKSIERIDLVSDPPPKLLQQAAMQVFRGSTSTTSVMGAHSLLEDMYGTNSISGTITATTAICAGQLVGIDPPASLTTLEDRVRCVGHVLTMTGGPAAGQSTRIVGYDSATPLFHLTPFEGQTVVSGNVFVNGVALSGDYIIGGTPFGGAGFGYTAAGALDAKDVNGWERALLPNHMAFPTKPTDTGYVATYPDPAGPGGANEDYDAADFHNMLLATQDYSGGTVRTTNPSLHRPALVNYWAANADWNDVTKGPILRRKVILRPLPQDHFTDSNSNGTYDLGEPCFTGSNLSVTSTHAWDPVAGPWDVDNDGDGVADSVWVDLGMPVRPTTDGRLYKPLFAILCVDLDGRLNLNAHGSLAQSSADTYYQATAGSFAGPTASASLPRGQGLGPAEVNLGPLFQHSPSPMPSTDPEFVDYRQLLLGNGTVDGRYGETTGTPRPGVAGSQSALSWNKWFEYRTDYRLFTTTIASYTPNAYGSPPDIDGSGVVGLDVAGRPLYVALDGTMTGDLNKLINNPYELNLSHSIARGLPTPATTDNPFSPSELERLLRPYDRDATSLPSRLAGLAPRLLNSGKRLLVTTESWDVPCPSAQVANLLLTNHPSLPSSSWSALLPPELLSGLRMNLNRPFGNGLDCDDPATPTHVGVVDEFSAVVKQAMQYDRPGNTVSVNLDPKNAAPVPATLDPRQLCARYLYVLAMLVSDLPGLDAQTGNRPNTARLLAQWAVNAVDFCDRDSTMTRFDYTDNPFTAAGWNAPSDGTLIVWGCERPELLIAETLAFHDRKTEDTTADPTGKSTTDPPPNDPNYDQIVAPEGSLFIELYNPWGPNESPAAEFGAFNRTTQQWTMRGGVSLNQTTPQGHPVWRLQVAIPNAGNDPDDPVTANQPTPERSIYFLDPTPANISGDGQQYHTTTAIAPVLPGRYAVIGPRTITYVGKETINPVGPASRQIDLNPNADPNVANQVIVINNDTTGGTTDLPTGNIKPPVAVIVDQPRAVSVSEPTGGYPPLSTPPADDTPFDFPPNRNDPALMLNGTTPSYRIIHLQRLANPRKAYNNTPASADYNPYVTIDSQPIDLTVFNGNIPNSIVELGGVNAGTVMFASHQRGETNNTGTDGVNDIWKQRLDPKLTSNPLFAPTPHEVAGTHIHNFDYALQHALGYLNTPFGAPRNGTDPATDPNSYRGDPPDSPGPFPWLTWHNRPYASQLELLLVPSMRSSQLLRQYSPTSGTPNPYNTFIEPFPHLLNLFQSANSSAPGTKAELHRLLDFVCVPSPFVGTEIQGNPASMIGGTHLFHPPFNRISTYREPGRINLNTIYSQEVFQGLLNLPDLSDGGLWSKLRTSRDQGYGVPGSYPTDFVNPFRSANSAYLVPLAAMKTAVGPEVNATLLRADPADATRALFQPVSSQPYDSTDRNPYFRYQGLERLGNLVTTRSNVYAVWITVGYFEVSPASSVDPTRWPDGYQLGRELGVDTGEIDRHRAFYIFDRTLPVGFQRGADLNVEKAILINRFIE